jgi:hypothetical protein
MNKTKNLFLEDERLSWRAKGILLYLLSKDESEIKSLFEISQDKEFSTFNGLRELRCCGYISKDENNPKEESVLEKPLFKEGYRNPKNFNKVFTDSEVLLNTNPVLKKI